MTPYERLELHPPEDDRIPHHPPPGVWPPETRIGRWALYLVVALVALVAVGLVAWWLG